MAENFQLRVEVPQGKTISAVQLLARANATSADTGMVRKGTVVEIDTLQPCESVMRFPDFLAKADGLAEEIHTVNKTLFFECLAKKTIDSLGPHYE